MSDDAASIARQIFARTLQACAGDRIVANRITRAADFLRHGDLEIDLGRYDRVWICGAGKASPAMAKALAALVSDRVTGGVVVGKAPMGSEDFEIRRGLPFDLLQSGHPVLDERSLRAGQDMLRLASQVGEGDLVLFALSGGASALLEVPIEPLTLSDLQMTNQALLASGWPIDRVNAVRKRLSKIKNGGLARAFARAKVVCIVLSDVLGDDLHSIGSGPFISDEPSEIRELPPGLPEPVRRILAEGPIPKPTPTVRHVILANAHTAASEAQTAAGTLGLNCRILEPAFRSEASQLGTQWGHRALELEPGSAAIAYGESVVQLAAKHGVGGRSQEAALAAAFPLAGHSDVAVLAAGTDGTDGPTEVAGAVVDGRTVRLAIEAGIDSLTSLRAHDAYPLHRAVGNHVMTGPTKTNLNDLAILVRCRTDG